MSFIVQFKDIVKRFGEFDAVRGLSLDIPAGARTIMIPGLFFGGGGFAGNFTPPLQSQSWGNVTFSFPSCNSLTLQFASTHNNATAPVGSGLRFWNRLTGVNGFGCE